MTRVRIHIMKSIPMRHQMTGVRTASLPVILPQYRIVPEGEYASSPWCPDQPHFRPPAERNDRTILAAVDVTGTAHGRADARRRKLVRLPSRALPARHR